LCISGKVLSELTFVIGEEEGIFMFKALARKWLAYLLSINAV